MYLMLNTWGGSIHWYSWWGCMVTVLGCIESEKQPSPTKKSCITTLHYVMQDTSVHHLVLPPLWVSMCALWSVWIITVDSEVFHPLHRQ